MILFWDTLNDNPEILGDDGQLWYYGEDQVAINQGSEGGRYWVKLCKVSNSHAFNDSKGRYQIYDPRLNAWVNLQSTHIETYREVYNLMGAECLE